MDLGILIIGEVGSLGGEYDYLASANMDGRGQVVQGTHCAGEDQEEHMIYCSRYFNCKSQGIASYCECSTIAYPFMPNSKQRTSLM